jgi:hypothetical protein
VGGGHVRDGALALGGRALGGEEFRQRRQIESEDSFQDAQALAQVARNLGTGESGGTREIDDQRGSKPLQHLLVAGGLAPQEQVGAHHAEADVAQRLLGQEAQQLIVELEP